MSREGKAWWYVIAISITFFWVTAFFCLPPIVQDVISEVRKVFL